MPIGLAAAHFDLAKHRTLAPAAGHSLGLALASLVTYLLITHVLAPIHEISKASDLLGGMWAVIATLFVYRESRRATVSAALTRLWATLLSFVLCLIYLLIFPFHPVGLAVVIGLGTFLLMAAGRDELVTTAAITTTVLMVVAAVSPHDAWQQPILRGVDTVVGIAVGVAAAAIAHRLDRAPYFPSVTTSKGSR
ncbi:MAG TPA: FUSC family protein [Baekduia sp.]